MIRIRPALSSDVGAIAALLDPEIARGTVLPRAVVAEDFLVAEERGALLGVVALTPWVGEVVELGALVVGPQGRGIGAMLVEAAMARAADRGFGTVVALTGAPGFFERVGFSPRAVAPWALARGLRRRPDPGIGPAVVYKAARCAACPRLGTCNQVLLSRPAQIEVRAVA